ncbi:response regulator [Desulfoferrobacter suflitae]|uniref:response regulator n=1 Tax=Desulfoferrobacter suflitae TaxID=2865782 RepID=UPI0021642C4F|nr:response regulator [Desulfoferrobacter suflitae]MCK8603578.1 response regulator [Desulfoferrobacter suflitae]
MDGETSKKILIVDDNKDSRDLTVKVLKRLGYQIIEAVDGEEALTRAFQDKPDLILMDRSLPKIDGLEVTRRLKTNAATQHIIILALTAHAMRGDKEKAIAAGCQGYIVKPIDVRKLPDEVKAHLEGERGSVHGGEKD